MTAFLAGGSAGLGVFLLAVAILPTRPSLTRQLAAYDQVWRRGIAPAARSSIRSRIGAHLAERCEQRGWRFASTRADLAIAGGSWEAHLASKVLLGLGGLVLGPLLALGLAMAGVWSDPTVPAGLGAVLGCGCFVLPDLELRRAATARRRDFRHALGAFLDLVAMNLAGGRGVPEALLTAGEVGSSRAFGRIRDALASARITGQTPWQALGSLGEDIGVAELRDLAAALGLVAEDGARVRQSLTARAASMRQRELADLAGRAGERSQSMLVAQMLLCVGFLVFLVYPVVGLLLGG